MKKHDLRREQKPYSGILADETFWPIGRSPIGIEKDVILGIFGDKLVALLDHYGISGGLDNPENGWLLALMLAGDHVPGFAPTYRTPAKPPHRPHDLWVGARDLCLCLELELAKLKGRSVRRASQELAERWRKEGKEGKYNWDGETLRRRYMRLRKKEPTEGMMDAARVLFRR